MNSVPSPLQTKAIDPQYQENRIRSIGFLVLLLVLLGAGFLLSLACGSYDTPLGELIRGIFGKAADPRINLVASSYFDFLYECALKLIRDGKAYVCDLSPEEIREYRGTLTEPGKNSPYRDRSVEENLDLFKRMTDGEFANGEKVLRAKIDMASPNMNMRDPVIYRIAHVSHHQTGDKWCVYPMYDFAHPLSDAAEHVTYSLCSLEFENHRPLYNWFIDAVHSLFLLPEV